MEFGLVASAIQVADTGLKLTSTIYAYVEKVRSADERLNELAFHIKVTSEILKQLAGLFQKELTARLITADAVAVGKETIEACSGIFLKVQAAVDKARQPGGKWSFPLKSSNLFLLLANVERHKSNLQLLLSVSLYARLAVPQ